MAKQWVGSQATLGEGPGEKSRTGLTQQLQRVLAGTGEDLARCYFRK